MSMLGQIGAARGPEIRDYRGYTFDQLVSIIRMQELTIKNNGDMVSSQARQIETLNKLHRNQMETITKQQKELQGLKYGRMLADKAERSPMEVKLADDNRLLRQDLKQAREQLLSLRSLLSDFENTPVNVANSELGIGGIHPGPKVMNEELLQRLRDQDAIRKQYNVGVTDYHRGRQYNVGIDVEKYVHDEHGPAAPPQTGYASDPLKTTRENTSSYGPVQQNGDPDAAQGTPEDFIRSIMPKGC